MTNDEPPGCDRLDRFWELALAAFALECERRRNEEDEPE
jgi:hypothetical protein